jgi:RNA polymerase sigma-70 factor (ECF subfamily)
MDSRIRPTPDRSGELLRRWQERGDEEALDELLATEIGHLKARIRARGGRRGGSDASVSDVAQEAVLRLLRLEEAPVFDSPQALRAYLWTAAWRLLAERLRRHPRRVARVDDSVSQALDGALATTGGLECVEASDRALALQLTVQLLEPAEREILELVYFRALGLDGAAARLGVSRDAAKMRCTRARAKLAHKLKRWSEIVG